MNTRAKLLMGAAVLGSLWVAGCDEDQNRVDQQDEMSRPGDVKPPDNTSQNRGDAATGAKTPFDQGEGPEDIKVTADIRKAILATDGMSVNGQNVKVITEGGVVTLRGVVESASEMDAIAEVARRTAGVTQIQNELQIDPN